MPSVKLYNHDVTFHSWGSPLHATSDAYQGHTAWNYLTSMVMLQPHFLESAFNQVAAGFNWAALTGSNGETGGTTAGWGFDYGENLAYRYGQAHAFVADMHRAFYAKRGLDYNRYAFMPQDAGSYGKDAPYDQYIQILHNTVGSLISGPNADGVIRGSTGDALTAWAWSGATGTTQANVLNNSIYSNEGANRFKTFCDGMYTGFDYELANRNITHPSMIAYDNEDEWNVSSPVWWYDAGNSNEEYGTFIQTLNNPRVNTYTFFDGKYTLKQLWGATGNTSQAFRSDVQYTLAYTFTGPDNLGSLTVTSDNYTDVIFPERVNSVNYAPNYKNFINSFLCRHKQHLIASSWSTWKTQENILVGNYDLVASTREYPSFGGKFPGLIYTCDVSCINSFTGHTSGATGTFPLDYSCPVLYLEASSDPLRMFPSTGTLAASYIYKNYSGAYGNSSLKRIGADSGLYSQGQLVADYVAFLQRCGSVGMTAMQGGGTAQGYTGLNLTDFVNYSLNLAKHNVNSTRSSLDKFTDNASKPVIPWIGNVAEDLRQTNIFSLTGSLSQSTVYTDTNGLTGFTVPAYDGEHINIPDYGTSINLQYNVDLIKWCIKTHNITDFFVFESNFSRNTAPSGGVTAANFWLDVFASLVADSNSEADSNALSRSTSSSVIYFAGKLYKRDQFEKLLQSYYPGLI